MEEETNFPDYFVVSPFLACTQATTTVGGCTLTFDGTSASCPVASAVIALALEVK